MFLQKHMEGIFSTVLFQWTEWYTYSVKHVARSVLKSIELSSWNLCISLCLNFTLKMKKPIFLIATNSQNPFVLTSTHPPVGLETVSAVTQWLQTATLPHPLLCFGNLLISFSFLIVKITWDLLCYKKIFFVVLHFNIFLSSSFK